MPKYTYRKIEDSDILVKFDGTKIVDFIDAGGNSVLSPAIQQLGFPINGNTQGFAQLTYDAYGNVISLGQFPLVNPASIHGALGDSITKNTVSSVRVLAVPVVVSGGTGYVLNDGIVLPNGVVLQVTTVSSGAATGVSYVSCGDYTSSGGSGPVAPSGTQSQVATTGVGSGFSCTIAVKGSGGTNYMYTQGFSTWEQILSDGKVIYPQQLIWGFGSLGTTELLAILPQYIAYLKANGANFCTVLIGTNDVQLGRTYSTITTNLAQIYAALLGAGIRVKAIPIIPRSYDGTNDHAGSSLAIQQAILHVNQFIVRYCQSYNGMYLADPTLNIVDLNVLNTKGYPIPYTMTDTTTGVVNTAYTYDGLHPSPTGAFFIGKALATLNSVLFPGFTKLVSQADTYDASANPTGNLFANGLVQTTTGGANSGSATFSGTFLSGFTFNSLNGATAATTIVGAATTTTLDNGLTRNQQQITMSSVTDAGSSLKIYKQLFSNYAAGDQIYGEVEVSISSPSGSILGIWLQVDDGITVARVGQTDTPFVMPNVAWSGLLSTKNIPITVTTGAGAIEWFLEIDLTAAGSSVVVNFSQCSLRKI